MASIRARLVKLENKRRFLDWFVWDRFYETLTVDELRDYARNGTLPEPLPNRPSKMDILDRKTLTKRWEEDERIFGDRSTEELIYFTKNGSWPEQTGRLHYSTAGGKMIAEWKMEPAEERTG